MRTELQTSAPRPEGDISLAGVLAWSELDPAENLDRLSARELESWGSLKQSRRRQSWLAGRIVAKFCWLRGYGTRVAAAASEVPEVLAVSAQALGAFSPWMYRRVEVSPAVAGEPPRLCWSGEPCGVAVSLTHAAGQSCAYLDSAGPIGADLEDAVPRREAFYRGNFTVSEREWAERLARETGAPRAWVYTLLWTLKECALKADESRSGTIWKMPLMELALSPEAGAWVQACARPGGAARCTFTARVSQEGRESRYRVGVSATETRIFSVMKRIE